MHYESPTIDNERLAGHGAAHSTCDFEGEWNQIIEKLGWQNNQGDSRFAYVLLETHVLVAGQENLESCFFYAREKSAVLQAFPVIWEG